METPRGTNAGWIAFVVIAIAGLGSLIYWQHASRERAYDSSGFDFAQVTQPPRPLIASQIFGPLAAKPVSSLNMVRTGMPLNSTDAEAAPETDANGRRNLSRMLWALEPKFRDLNKTYRARFSAVVQYEKEWMSSPDLRKLRDDYMLRDHDPIKFVRGLVESKNFAVLVKNYAKEPEIRAFATDALKQAPSQVIMSASDSLNHDANVRKVIANILQALGLPSLMLGSRSQPQIDQKAVIDSLMKNNPELRRAMPTQELQNGLQNQPQ